MSGNSDACEKQSGLVPHVEEWGHVPCTLWNNTFRYLMISVLVAARMLK